MLKNINLLEIYSALFFQYFDISVFSFRETCNVKNMRIYGKFKVTKIHSTRTVHKTNNKLLTTFVVRWKQKSAVKQDSTFWNIFTKILSLIVIGTKFRFKIRGVGSKRFFLSLLLLLIFQIFRDLDNFLFSLSLSRLTPTEKKILSPRKHGSIENHWKQRRVPLSNVSGFSRDLFLILFARTFLRYRGIFLISISEGNASRYFSTGLSLRVYFYVVSQLFANASAFRIKCRCMPWFRNSSHEIHSLTPNPFFRTRFFATAFSPLCRRCVSTKFPPVS